MPHRPWFSSTGLVWVDLIMFIGLGQAYTDSPTTFGQQVQTLQLGYHMVMPLAMPHTITQTAPAPLQHLSITVPLQAQPLLLEGIIPIKIPILTERMAGVKQHLSIFGCGIWSGRCHRADDADRFKKLWSPRPDLNRWPLPYQGSALPTELRGLIGCG